MLQGCTPWPEEYAKLYRSQGYWEDKTLSEVLDLSIRKFGSKEALVYEDLRLNYTQLGEKIDRLAYQFVQLGLKPLERVVLQLPNCPEFIYTYFAMLKIGVIPVMGLAPHRQTEINHFIDYSEAVGYVIPEAYRKFDYVAMAREIRSLHKNLRYVFVNGNPLDGFISIQKLLELPVNKEEIEETLARYHPDPCEAALMLLSGGTTALPKLIPRTHNDYVYNTKQSCVVTELNEQTRMLILLPMAHNYTLASPGFQGVLFFGGTVIISPNTDIEMIFSLVEKEKITMIPTAVPLISNWLNSEIPFKYDLESLKLIQNGGSRLAPELRKRLREQFNCIPQEVFGTAEGLLNMTRLDDKDDLLLNSSGKPISQADEIKIIDENGNELPDGEAGELVIRGPYTIQGYYNAPEINAKAFTPDGFYRMGDECRKNEEGHVFAEGRFKDLINRGGEKISCAEIENLLFTHPKVKSVSLVAMPDEVYGEKACAFIILKPDQQLSFDELTDFFVQQNIAKFKFPERLAVVNEFPLSPAGKILKRKLREMIAETIDQEKGTADTVK